MFLNFESNTYTISFWIFLNDISKIGNNLINLVFGPYMMISFGLNGYLPAIFCNPYVGYYPNIKNIISFSTMKTLSSDSNYSMIYSMFNPPSSVSFSATWNNVRCAVNLSTLKAWGEISYAEYIYYKEVSLKKPSYFKNRPFDYTFSFHNFSNNNNLAKFSIINANNLNTNVFINHIQIWKTYHSADIKFQYYDFSNISSVSDVPGLHTIISISHMPNLDIGPSLGENYTDKFTFTKVGDDKRALDSF
jgi:hypothetical protein